ncbi:unnamed protein product [Leuciscus chuanchicus]
MQLDIAVRLIDNAKTSLSRYRHSGFAEAVSTAKELCEAMNIEPELKEKRLRNTKRQFAYETADEPFSDALKILEVTFFNSVVDSALMSLQGRFETMTQVRDKFGVLLDFSRVHGMSKEDLQKKCIEVQKTLTEEGNSDIDGLEMVQEIINLPQLSPQTTALELLTFLHENCLQEVPMMEENTDVFNFLRHRGISEEAITVMEQQKIYREVILLMEDAELAKYLPSYGDRIALIHFCRHQTPSVKRKQGLLEKLREKMKLRREGNKDEEVPQTSNKKARSKVKSCIRNIEIGWLHKENKGIKQVRARQGGGTRKLQINVQAGYDDILKEGKALFFHNGVSTKGQESDFEFEVWDFKQNLLPKDLSVGRIYNTVKLPILRFYIATHPKINLTEESSESSDESDHASDISNSDPTKGDDLYSHDYEQLEVNEPQDTLPDVFLVSDEETSIHSSQDHLASIALNVSSDPEITFGPQHHIDGDSLSDTVIHERFDSPQSAPNALPNRNVTIHYSNSFSDMIEAYSDHKIVNQSLTVRRILPNNSEEAGSGPGVLRDVYSSFWSDFYEHCTVGTSVKVPFLRHDFSSDK